MSPIVTLNNGEDKYRRQALTPAITPSRTPEIAFYSTIKGTKRLMDMQKDGVDISDEQISNGIKANSIKLGITEDEYREKLRMITDPKPENNPTPDSNPEAFFASQILNTAELMRSQREGLNISNDEIFSYKERSADKLGIDIDEYNEKLDMVLNPQPETDPSISDEVREPFV